ncbi:MAG: hypothetical protein ACJ77K_00800 [Bacteroidia bacterium]
MIKRKIIFLNELDPFGYSDTTMEDRFKKIISKLSDRGIYAEYQSKLCLEDHSDSWIIMKCWGTRENLSDYLRPKENLKKQIVLFGVPDIEIISCLDDYGIAAAVLEKFTYLYIMGYALPHFVCFWGLKSAVSQMNDLMPDRFVNLYKREDSAYRDVSSLVKRDPLDLLLEYLEILENEKKEQI